MNGRLWDRTRACLEAEGLGEGRGESPATRNRTGDHLIAAKFYSQMLYQLSYSRLAEKKAGLERPRPRPAGGPSQPKGQPAKAPLDQHPEAEEAKRNSTAGN